MAKPEVGIELRRGKDPRELVRIGSRGVVIGVEGGTRVWKFFTEPRRADDAWYFLRTYASFEMKTPQGDLTFRGHGKRKPGPAERRMIFDWARQVAGDAAGGRGGAAHGLVLAWHQGSASGVCEEVVVYLTGEVVAMACGWDSAIQGRLEPAQASRVYDWFDRLKAFQASGGDQEIRPGSLQTRVVFAGRGVRAARTQEAAEIQSFGDRLFVELAARRRGAAPAPPQPAAGAEATPVPPTARLLLPPGFAVARAEEILLQLPERPPPPPRPSPPRPSSPVSSQPLSPGEDGEGHDTPPAPPAEETPPG